MIDTLKPRSNATKTILVVEDSPTQAMHLQTMLEQYGLEVICAWNGRVGLQMAHQVHPNLIILDVQMPEMDGFEVCQKLKESRDTADIPVIIFTRHDDPKTASKGLQTGATDYIPKDAFADAVLIETLRQIGMITQEPRD